MRNITKSGHTLFYINITWRFHNYGVVFWRHTSIAHSRGRLFKLLSTLPLLKSLLQSPTGEWVRSSDVILYRLISFSITPRKSLFQICTLVVVSRPCLRRIHRIHRLRGRRPTRRRNTCNTNTEHLCNSNTEEHTSSSDDTTEGYMKLRLTLQIK